MWTTFFFSISVYIHFFYCVSLSTKEFRFFSLKSFKTSIWKKNWQRWSVCTYGWLYMSVIMFNSNLCSSRIKVSSCLISLKIVQRFSHESETNGQTVTFKFTILVWKYGFENCLLSYFYKESLYTYKFRYLLCDR